MDLDENLFATLKDLVANEVRPDTFPQPPRLPVWPAIRYTIVSGEAFESIKDDGDTDTDDTLVQLDIVAATAPARKALLKAVRARMKTFDPPARLQGVPRTTYDAETKTYVASADYMIHASGGTPSL